MNSDDKWFLRYRRRPDPVMRLYCFPWAGGGAQAFRSWARAAPPELELVAVQLPGRGHRLQEAPFDTWAPLVDELEAAFRRDVSGPFALYGHCCGGFVAHALARRIADELLPEHLFITAARAPSIASEEAPLHTLPEAQLVAEAQRRFAGTAAGTPMALIDNDELRRAALPAFRADSKLTHTYDADPTPHLPCPIHAFAAQEDDLVSPEEMEAWRPYTSSRFDLTLLPTQHFPTGAALQQLRESVELDLVGKGLKGHSSS